MELQQKAKIAAVNQYFILRQSHNLAGLAQVLEEKVILTDSNGRQHLGFKEVEHCLRTSHGTPVVTLPPVVVGNIIDGHTVVAEYTVRQLLVHHRYKAMFTFTRAPLNPKIIGIVVTRA